MLEGSNRQYHRLPPKCFTMTLLVVGTGLRNLTTISPGLVFWPKQAYGDGALLGSSTLINADDVSCIRLEASGLGYSEWLSITEARFCLRDTEIPFAFRTGPLNPTRG